MTTNQNSLKQYWLSGSQLQFFPKILGKQNMISDVVTQTSVFQV